MHTYLHKLIASSNNSQMEKIVLHLNKYESFLLLFWAILVAISFEDLFPLGPAFLIVSGVLSIYYLLKGRYDQFALAHEKVYLRMFPSLFGNFSSIAVFGIYFKSMNYPGSSVMLNVGAIGLVVCAIALFYPPIQNHFQPYLKKFYLRIVVLVVLIAALTLY